MINVLAPARVTLPNGREIVCSSRHEALLVYNEVGHYVRHGMSLRPGDVIFDVGANMGLFSLWAYDQCHQDCSIFAFEPIPPIYALLEENVRRLGSNRVRAFPVGLSGHAQRATFAFHPHATFASTAFPESSDLELAHTLMARSLDRLPPPLHLVQHFPGPLQRGAIRALSRIVHVKQPVECDLVPISRIIRDEGVERIDFLKIDVEKSELDVLRGLEKRHWPLIRQAFVEVHNRDGRAEIIRDLFHQHGFSKVLVEQDPYFEGTEIVGVYAAR